MSDIQVTAQTLSSIVPHPNADRLEIATILGTQTIVPKGQEMKANCKSWIQVTLMGVLYGIIVQLGLPFIGGLYYATCGDHDDEQMYLDRCIQHLKLLRHCTHDPDLQGVLDYAIQRYNRVGPWDVMFMPLNGPLRREDAWLQLSLVSRHHARSLLAALGAGRHGPRHRTRGHARLLPVLRPFLSRHTRTGALRVVLCSPTPLSKSLVTASTPKALYD